MTYCVANHILLTTLVASVLPHLLKTLWRGRRTSNAPLDQSGVWRYREMIPFLDVPIGTAYERHPERGCFRSVSFPEGADDSA